jgi:hypothetical protein
MPSVQKVIPTLPRVIVDFNRIPKYGGSYNNVLKRGLLIDIFVDIIGLGVAHDVSLDLRISTYLAEIEASLENRVACSKRRSNRSNERLRTWTSRLTSS